MFHSDAQKASADLAIQAANASGNLVVSDSGTDPFAAPLAGLI
jgi:hypothetical protein